jgi:hypothetical protein
MYSGELLEGSKMNLGLTNYLEHTLMPIEPSQVVPLSPLSDSEADDEQDMQTVPTDKSKAH